MQMRSVTGKRLAAVLAENGWERLRVRGSHWIFGKPGCPVRLSLPMHRSRSLNYGLVRHLLNQAGLTEEALWGD